jgi:hypothetical protein
MRTLESNNVSGLRKGRIDSPLPEDDDSEDEHDYEDFEHDPAFEMETFLKEYVNQVQKKSSSTAFAYWIRPSPGDFGVQSKTPLQPLGWEIDTLNWTCPCRINLKDGSCIHVCAVNILCEAS